MEATRIELAQKNMQIQSLQYDLYKLQDKCDNEIRSLTKEVEWGREKLGSLKLEIRRLKEQDSEDTISIIRGQPVASKQKEDSEVGVVSNVAIYSLKAKVGKLESETQKLNEKVHQLEREKATLSLLNTEASNKKVKGGEDKLKSDSGRRLPEVSTETLERDTSVLGVSSSTENIPAAEGKKLPERKETFQNWLSGDAAKNMFQDEPNQCANQ
ncbi:hypothetical protein OS493_025390 [Desmophyllum pertusum]|uniref:Uncharacterized protein n=1 Tax=Desmophyllum pertusum TaxID=174260 RepID=A0A9X0CS58_9CNID|nr:hypothetical protein OS493_025390 [Desmophyllum pertusum]